jgi:enoyl-CoA hydratase
MGTWSLEIDEGVAVLTFSRPPANWMDLASMTELAEHLDALAGRTDEVRVVMLTGGVDGYFIAHADLDDLALIAAGGQPEGDFRAWSRATGLLGSMPQPTVAAIDGQAWGGGCETALACSMRVGSERAHLAQPEVAVGIIPGAGGTQRLPRLVGQGIGIELCTSGRRVFAEEALRIGLLNAVLPSEGFVGHAVEWCGRIARNPAPAVFAAKQAVVEGLQLPLADGLALEARMFLEINASDEARARNASIRRPTGPWG